MEIVGLKIGFDSSIMRREKQVALALSVLALNWVAKRARTRLPLPESKALVVALLVRNALRRGGDVVLPSGGVWVRLASAATYIVFSSPEHRTLVGGLVLSGMIHARMVRTLASKHSRMQKIVPTLLYCLLASKMIQIWNRNGRWFSHGFHQFLDTHTGMSGADIAEMRELIRSGGWWGPEHATVARYLSITAASAQHLIFSVGKLHAIKVAALLAFGKRVSLRASIQDIGRNVVSIGAVFNLGIVLSMGWARLNHSHAPPPQILQSIAFCIAGMGVLAESPKRRIAITSFVAAQLLMGAGNRALERYRAQ